MTSTSRSDSQVEKSVLPVIAGCMVLTFLIPPFFFVTVPVSVVYGFTHASGRAKWVVAIVAAIAMLFIWMLFVPTSVGQHH